MSTRTTRGGRLHPRAVPTGGDAERVVLAAHRAERARLGWHRCPHYGPDVAGSWKTIQFAKAAHRPFVHIALDVELEPAAKLRQWCEEQHVVTMNVAGSRESKAPGIQVRARDVIVAAFTSCSLASE